MNNAPTITPAIIILAGTEMRRIIAAEPTAPHAHTVRRIGNLDIQLCRTGDKWRLYVQALTPVPHSARDLWATAVSAPSVEWQRTPDGRLVWCEWVEQQAREQAREEAIDAAAA